MKILIFGDTHLGAQLDEKKYKFLVKIINSADKVIINGDFWDRAFCTFEDFLISDWNKLFPVLKDKGAVYIYGNHDRAEYNDKRVESYSVRQCKEYSFESGKKEFFVTHGDEQIYWYGIFPDMFELFAWRVGATHENIMLKLFGSKYLLRYFNSNRKFTKWKLKNIPKDTCTIYNHTHLQNADEDTRCYNSGWIRFNMGQYITVENGEIVMHNEKY